MGATQNDFHLYFVFGSAFSEGVDAGWGKRDQLTGAAEIRPAGVTSIHPSSLPPCPVLLWRLVEAWDRFCLNSFDPFISLLVISSAKVGGVTSLPSSHSVFPSILYPPCTVFSNQSEWLIPRHNYTRLFVKFIATLCTTKIASSPPFLFRAIPCPFLRTRGLETCLSSRPVPS